MMQVKCLVLIVLLIFSTDGEQECQDSLGMENGAITDGQISASSEWDPVTHSVNFGRLYYKLGSGAWVVRTNDANQWIQIDLVGQLIRVTRVATQGRYNHPQWVSKYSLQYSNDGVNFQYYREHGQTTDKVFNGNTDQNTVVSQTLNPPIRARYIRFRPMAWNDRISMRVELYGCLWSEDQVAVFTTSGLGKTLSGYVISSNYAADSLECMELCLVTAQCKSFNFSEKRRICEVSGYTAKEKKEDYGDNEDFDYYEPVKHTVINIVKH